MTRIEANAAGWNLGGATLTPWMLCGYPARPWTWVAPDTYGPFVLAIYVDRSAADLENWLNMFKPHGYVRKGHQDFHWNDDSGARLWIEEGRLMLTSQSSPQAARHAVDATLLGSVCDGDLGTELSWDFIDDDYRVYLATGHDLHSLREYVHARGPGLERFKAGQETVPCSGPRDLSALAARLRAKSLSELPRNVGIQLPPAILETWEQNPDVQAVLTSKSRIRFTLSAMKD